ncbi:hypothetical protein chiPu_0019484 [Chiloscyllium punctatum]|uniref:Ig-like domain-containing protein n=1 Tax=Chiloscyllium punctatum TaxID=137246 RepID=A0A401RRY7_CHIPU|nr:hypothetical protein [Chiloscyllium punctatum]
MAFCSAIPRPYSISCLFLLPRPTEVTWSRLNDSLPRRTEQHGNRMVLPTLSSLDNGTYLCQAENELGSSTDQYVLVVHGSYLTHEASGLDEHGEAREAFINGNENHERKKEYFI